MGKGAARFPAHVRRIPYLSWSGAESGKHFAPLRQNAAILLKEECIGMQNGSHFAGVDRFGAAEGPRHRQREADFG